MNAVTLEQRAAAELDEPLISLIPASSIRCQPIRWCWKGWIARGKLHVLAGAPGTGKTTIALAIAAAITRGSRWPDGTVAPLGRVAIWSGEDDPADTLVPRLRAAGADLARVVFVGATLYDGEPRPFDPATDLSALTMELERHDGISLLIADPVVSAVAGDSHKNTEVRRALQPLVNMAQRLDCAVLGISHFSKGSAGRDPTERVTGSIAFGALARVVLVTAKAEDGQRLLARAKSNIGPDGGGFAYDLELAHADGLEASRVTWGEALEGSARELLGDAEAIADSPRDDAGHWLAEMLAGAEVPVKDIRQQATAAGFSWRTIERAKSDLGVVALPVGKSDGSRGVSHWSWRLAEKSATVKSASPTTNNGGVNETLMAQGIRGDLDIKPATSQVGGLLADFSVDAGEVDL